MRRRWAAWLIGSALLLPGSAGGQRAPLLPPLLGLDELFAVPEDNPLTPAKIALGRRLFFDRRLSRNQSMSCSSCHRPGHGFADHASRSPGVRKLPARRHTPTLLNRAYGGPQFWDGRASSLESQVLQPIADSLEMDLPLAEAVRRLARSRSYGRAFDRVFGAAPSAGNLARALATYVRTLRSGNSPVDRFREGERSTLSAPAQRGMRLFLGRANCFACHSGANFTDERFHNTGVGLGSGDPGRFAVTGDSADLGAFKTPTLRDVARTAPYMHDGSLSTLLQVIEFYDRGGRAAAGLDPEIKPLGLSRSEKLDVVRFLEALTGGKAAKSPRG